jgi:hypothetical protein
MVIGINLISHNYITNFHIVQTEVARNCTSTIAYRGTFSCNELTTN